MPPKSKKTPVRKSTKAVRTPSEIDVDTVIDMLKRSATKHTLEGMSRYAIPSDKAFGVLMADIQKIGKQVGVNHKLAADLWDSEWYEARTLSAFVEDPEQVSAAQMDRWCRDFDSWAICDTLCFKLFDRSPHAYQKVAQWAKSRQEFVKRAAFALLASLALHDKRADNKVFIRLLPLIEDGANDSRNFVKKGVSWALRSIAHRNAELKAAAMTVAERLANSSEPSARWVGKDALREFNRPAKTRK